MALRNTWWAKDNDNGESLSRRIAAINKINDPTTNADEILRYGKMLLWLLLAFTGLLGALSYYKNFADSFGHEAAIFMAACLTIVIEVGKNYTAKWALRIPFFRGFGHIAERPENTFVWVGLVAISAATFYMSVFNSTIGGEQLSKVMHHERHQSKFAPDTRAIDSQIEATQKGMAENQSIKWKGTTTYTAQKAIAKQSSALENLQQQRSQTIAQQRTDWERQQAIQSDKSNFAASLVMASGGWVELLQFLVILLLVSCEKSLDKSLPSQTQGNVKQGIGFRNAAPAIANHYPAEPSEQPRNPIGFHRHRSEQPPTVPDKTPVEHCATQISPQNSPKQSPTVPARATGVLADIKYWQKLAKMTLERSLTQQREEKRQDNATRYEAYRTMLEAIGIAVERGEGAALSFHHPKEYDTSDAAMRIVETQYRILWSLKNRSA